MNPPNDRRRVLSWMGAAALSPLALTPVLADDHRATPAMTEGPFYPRSMPRDSDADLTRVEGNAARAKGTPLAVSGRVVDRSGKPVAGSRVEIWQCDNNGVYHLVGEPEAAIDAGFQGFGAVSTDAEGRYAFNTIKPVAYPGRTPHIHVAVLEGRRRRLTTQFFLEGDPGNARDGIYRHLGADAKLVTMKLEQAGAGLRTSLDIVLA